ncbi:MAG: flagellar motor switch protein FliG [Chloroflexi bacterium]|nr:flagellar motor switch protein FliG [Chloroflexota bacterium]MDA1147578.1 flagellar motor switch protein FliG [Chloroflexota bacterium]
MTPTAESGSPARNPGYGPRRAAQLMVALGRTHASQVLTHLPEEQVAHLAWLVAHTEQLGQAEREDVLRDFYASLTSRDYASVGGPETVQQILEAAFGSERAADLQSRLGRIGRPKPFKFLEYVSTGMLVEFLVTEHPQLIALMFANLNVDHAAELLMLLPPELQIETLVRIVHLDKPSFETVELTEAIVQGRLVGAAQSPTAGPALVGANQLVEVLRHVDIATQRVILEGIEDLDPELAVRIRQQMFVFDDLALLDPRSLQRVLREINQADLTLALRAADEHTGEVIFANMSTRASAMVHEDMAALGPIRLTLVHEAQNRIVTIVRRLQDDDEIVVNRGGDDQLVA